MARRLGKTRPPSSSFSSGGSQCITKQEGGGSGMLGWSMIRSRSEEERGRVSSSDGSRWRSLERVMAIKGRKRGMWAGLVGSSLCVIFSL
jgi:hypothetical protein